MKVGDLVEYKIPTLAEEHGVALVTKLMPNPHDSVTYKIEVTWKNGVVTPQFNWEMKKVST